MIALWAGLFLATAPGLIAHAEPNTDLAAAVIKAHEAADNEALQRLARAHPLPVRWQLIELLAADGNPEAGVAFAAAVEGPESKALQDYATHRTRAAPSKDLMQAIRLWLFREISPQAWFEKFGTGSVIDDGFATSWMWTLRARCAKALKRTPQNIADDYMEAAQYAHQLGSYQAALDAYAFGWQAIAKQPSVKDLLRKYIAAAREADNVKHERRANVAMFQVLYRERRFEQMLPYAEDALRCSKSISHRQAALKYVIMAEIQLGHQHAAARHLLEMRRLSALRGDEMFVYSTDIQIASNEALLGRPAAGLARLGRALAYLEGNKRTKPGTLRGAHMHAAVISNELLDGKRALRHVEQALKFGKGLGYNDGVLRAIQAEALLSLNRPAEALVQLKLALKLGARDSAYSKMGNLLKLVYALIKSNRVDEAEPYLVQARHVAARTTQPEISRLAVDHTACLAYIARGQWDDLISAATSAIKRADKLLMHSMLDSLNGWLALAWLKKGDPKRALEHAKESVAGTLRRSAALPDRTGAHFRSRMNAVFAVAIEAAVQSDDVDAAFSFAERACAVALRTRLGQEDAVFSALDDDLRIREIELQEAETAAVATYRRAVARDDEQGSQQAAKSLHAVREQLDRHREQILSTQASASLGIEPPTDTLKATQARMAPDEILILLASGRRQLYAMVVRADSARIVDLGAAHAIERQCEDALIDDTSFPADETIKQLRRTLFTPMKLPADATHVTLVPTGPMSTVPYAALLGDRQVTLLPSVATGRLVSTGSRQANGILAVGDPASADGRRLPAARAEAKAVGDVVLLDKAASEPGLLEALAKRPLWRAVHIACHGLIDPIHPLRSALSLTPTPATDGLWTVSEILRAKVPTTLAVIGSCSTGRGKHFDQEGTLGFVHAFFVAGAERVIVSLWDVDDDAASAFLQRFHKEWTPGTPPSAALQRARTWMRAQKQWKHPANWAAWQLWGPR